MKKNLLGKMVITGIISAAMLASTAASTWAADKSDKDVLRLAWNVPMHHSTGPRIQIQLRTEARQNLFTAVIITHMATMWQ